MLFDVFIGTHENKVDTKGRVSIPAEFRRILEQGDPSWESGKNPTMVLVYGDARRDYIEVFSVADLKKIHRQIARMPRGSKKRAELQKLYGHQVAPAQVDETGRIVLTSKLRDKVGIADKALIVGNGESFMIWRPETYEADGLSNLHEDDDYDSAADPSVWLPADDDDDGVF